ncbi:MAG: peptidylprolyl isomerase [Brumimicrobium sp.]|nr:peptidylprolyl isomerase [Brumimicrobium sp.]
MKYIILALLVILGSIPVFSQTKQKLEKGLYAEIITDRGTIFLKLYPEQAPLTVANFVGLAEGKLKVFDTIKHTEPYYDSVKFHRVISDFMIQGGDPTGTGSGGPGYKFFDEADNGLKHLQGALSMANAGPNTNGSQFFITHVATPHLDGRHTVFGQVLEGQSVVDAIQQNDYMREVNIIRKGLKYKWFYNPSKIFREQYEILEKKEKREQEKIAKLQAQEKVRLIEAQGQTKEKYKEYFYGLIKQDHPQAVQTESGLVYLVEQQGTGEKPEKGDKVSLHYTGTFLFGDKFDSSLDRGQPLEFDYLVMNLIPGFNEGVGLASEGTKIKLFIPYYLAYGERGRRPSIPPHADLIFDLEILEVIKK